MKNKLLVGLVILAMSLVGAANARAQQAQEAQPGVARISLLRGDVNTQRGDSGDWVPGALNAPVVAGDRVSTGTASRLELTLDFANFLRLDERSEAKIAELTGTRIQVQVARGIVDYSVFKGNEADIEIDTPNVAIHPVREGRYRIQITADDQCEVIVREGEADITTPQGSTRIKKGQMISVRGIDNPEYQTADAPRNDSWDDWNKDRDHQVQNAESWSRTNRYYTGVNDLDGYGHWTYIPGYGYVWVPAQGAGWAPYRDGRWVWEPYWGWTWVSYEPWGWAPYHYGRWFAYGGSWCWWPGPVYAGYRPYWGPAFVSFFGFSGRHFGVGVGFGFGSIGWLPLGPADYCYPWWGGYRRNLTVVNIVNINNFHGDRRFGPLWNGRGRGFSNLHGMQDDRRLRDGITTMRAEQFGRGPVPRDFQRVTSAEFREGRMVAGAVPVVPTRESLRPVDRAVNPASLPARGGQERFFTRSRPTFTPEPFHAEQARVQDMVRQHEMNGPMRHEGDARIESPGGRNAPAGRINAPNGQNAPNSGDRVMRGPAAPPSPMPNSASRPATQAPAPNEGSRGWSRFGGERGGAPAQQAPRQAGPQAQAPERQRPDSQPPARNNAQPAPNQSGDWQRFSRQDRQRNQGNAPPAAQAPNQGQRQQQAAPSERPGWQRSTPQPQAQRPYAESPRSYGRRAPADSPRSSSRPELNLRRPIMTPRSSSGPEVGNRGGRSSAPPPSARGSSRGSDGSRGSSRPPQGSSRPNRKH